MKPDTWWTVITWLWIIIPFIAGLAVGYLIWR